MNGVVELADKLRTVNFMGVFIRKVWLMEACSDADNHVLFVSKNSNGSWLLSLISKRPEPAIVRQLQTPDDDQAIRIAGLITSHDDPKGFFDTVKRSGEVDNSTPGLGGLVTAELCERIHRAMRCTQHAA